jgi:hypothetical protein
MENFMQVLIQCADALSGPANVFFAAAGDGGILSQVGGSGALAFAAGMSYSNIPAEILTAIRRWHGTIDDQAGNIDNLVVTIQAHSSWGKPAQFSKIVANRTQLLALILKCRSAQGSAADRGQRDLLLKTTVDLCLTQVKAWAYMQYYNNVITLNDLHTLGFLLPGEAGGRHERAEAVNVLAEVKVSIISADIIRVVIDQAADENAALVAHGWPHGVRQALIVITAADGVTEVLRLLTTHLHNDIRMPDGSHGKQFIIKASFLRHIDDEPRFGPAPTFSMPLTTEDLVNKKS